MQTFDWLQQEKKHEIVEVMKAAMNDLNETEKLTLIRDLMIEQIYITIDKFPLQSQKEMLAIITDKYLRKWNKKTRQSK